MPNDDLEVVGEIARGDGTMEPVYKVPYGRKIDTNGIYDMPMAWYHDDSCVGPSASSSGLRTIVNQTPLHFWDKSKLNPDRREETDDEDAAHFRIGRAAHTLVIEPEHFKGGFVTRPSHFDSWRSKDSQKWRAEKQTEGFTVLNPTEMQNIHGVASALRKHPLYDQGLLEGDIERSVICLDKKSGVWLKSRPDVIPTGSNILADLKTVTDARSKALRNKIYDLGYDVQMALARVCIWEVLARRIEEFVLVAVEVKPPHAIRIAPIPEVEINRAMLLLRHGIDLFKQAWEAKDWPAFAEEDNDYLFRNDFAAKRIDHLIETGKLPKEF